MDQIKIVFFGDSLTQCTYLDDSISWPNLCLNAIEREFLGFNFRVHNRGVCGENSSQALVRMQNDVQLKESDIITLQFGANDSVFWKSKRGVPIVSEKDFRSNLCKMTELAATFGVQQIIFHTNHKLFKERIEINNKTHNENLLAYNQIIRDIAEERDCALVDMHEELSAIRPSTYTLPYPDGIHLNELGCRLYAQALLPILIKCINNTITDDTDSA